MSDTLVLFSGGKDSFIAACREAEAGHIIHLFSCNPGWIINDENLQHGVKRLQNRYGADRIIFEGVYSTTSWVQRFSEKFVYTSLKDLSKDCPNMTMNQVRCLHCQTAMWFSALAYAKSKSFQRIVSGYRSTDPFCTGMIEYQQYIRQIAQSIGIDVDFPVYSEDTWEREPWRRDNEMIRRGFEPQVLEPRCTVGMPADVITKSEQSDLMRYLESFLPDAFGDHFNELVEIFKYIRV